MRTIKSQVRVWLEPKNPYILFNRVVLMQKNTHSPVPLPEQFLFSFQNFYCDKTRSNDIILSILVVSLLQFLPSFTINSCQTYGSIKANI